jgi:hypothetical protein
VMDALTGGAVEGLSEPAQREQRGIERRRSVLAQ